MAARTTTVTLELDRKTIRELVKYHSDLASLDLDPDWGRFLNPTDGSDIDLDEWDNADVLWHRDEMSARVTAAIRTAAGARVLVVEDPDGGFPDEITCEWAVLCVNATAQKSPGR